MVSQLQNMLQNLGVHKCSSLAKRCWKLMVRTLKNQKRRLGRGLEALFDESPQVQETEEITEIPLDKLGLIPTNQERPLITRV